MLQPHHPLTQRRPDPGRLPRIQLGPDRVIVTQLNPDLHRRRRRFGRRHGRLVAGGHIGGIRQDHASPLQDGAGLEEQPS
jgi:hypothetical protein